MPRHVKQPTIIPAAGEKPKSIAEFVGRVNTKTDSLSIAVMRSPEGWIEPWQRPEFHEYTVVLRGTVRVEHEGGTIEVRAGEAIIAEPGESIRYSTPLEGGAEYVAVCLPAFSPATVHRRD